MLAGRLEGLGKMVRSGLTREELPPAPPPASATAPPVAAPRAPRGRVAARGPSGAVRATGRSLLSVLLSRESLPLDPERKRTHRNWLAFLFAPERIDPPGGAGPEVH